VFVFGGLNRLEIPRFGNVRHVPPGCGAMFPSRPCGFVELMTEGSEVGCPPGLGVVRRPGDRSVFLEEGSESIQ